MPTYEYRCPECRNEFEKFQRMSDEPGAECPACGANATRRLSAGAGLLFKGSGFYITDYRSDSYKKAAGSDNGGDKGSTSKGDSGSGETKTAKEPGTSSAKPDPKNQSSKSD